YPNPDGLITNKSPPGSPPNRTRPDTFPPVHTTKPYRTNSPCNRATSPRTTETTDSTPDKNDDIEELLRESLREDMRICDRSHQCVMRPAQGQGKGNASDRRLLPRVVPATLRAPSSRSNGAAAQRDDGPRDGRQLDGADTL